MNIKLTSKEKDYFKKLINKRIKWSEDENVFRAIEKFITERWGDHNANFFSETFNPDEDTLKDAFELMKSFEE